jgi:HSP20 family protein
MISLRYLPHEFQSELNRMRSQLDELFAGRGGAWPTLDPTGFPPVNAWEDDNAFYVEAELPGIAQEDLEITMADATTLSIKGARKEPALESAKWHRRERGFGSFERSLALPGPVDTDNVEASCKHGVLTIKLPKAPELRPRKIEVKVS